jgi:hypothetical protein
MSCSNNKTQKTEVAENETIAVDTAKIAISPPIYHCNVLRDTSKLYTIADSLLKIKWHPNIINLHTIDSSGIIVFEDNFIYPCKKSKMVFFSGEAGFSSGNSNCLLILFHCGNNKAKIIWAGQTNLFKKENINDLNGNGIKEIVSTSGAAWMSSVRELFEIISFKNGKRNTLYSTLSNTQRDYFEEDWYNIGDTISCVYQNKILPNNQLGVIRVKQTKTVKLFNGGKTKDEAFKKCKVIKNSKISKIKSGNQ